jgi:hypothetical protein
VPLPVLQTARGAVQNAAALTLPGQQGWPRPPHGPHEPAVQVMPGALPQLCPGAVQRVPRKPPEGTQQPPSLQTLSGQHG